MSTKVFAPILLAGAAAAALTFAPAAGAVDADDCPRGGAAAACAPIGHSAISHSRTGAIQGYGPFSAHRGDSAAPDWVME